MTKSTLDFLKRLLDAPGPSGFETGPARVWREEVKTFAEEVTTDVHGNSIATLNAKGRPRLMLAGHIDEIGLQVTHIDDDGYLYFAAIGGWDRQVLVGQRVVIIGPKDPVSGVIGKPAVHLMKKEEMEKVSKISDLWIDVGAATKAEALERVRVGDAGVLDAAVREFPNRRIVSRSIDNRIGAYLVAEATRILAKDRPKHAAVFAVATTREEIAWMGGGARTSAVGIDPQVALVVDVTHATDYPGAEKKRAGEHKLGGGLSALRESQGRSRGGFLPRGVRGLHQAPEGPDGGRRARQPQRLHGGRAQHRGLTPEEPPGRLGGLDERQHGVGTPDAAESKDQLALHRLVLLLLHRDDERHREGAGLESPDPQRHLHPHLGRPVPQRVQQRLRGAAPPHLREGERHRFADPVVRVLELPRERRHRVLEAQLPHELGTVADDEPLSMIVHG